MPPPGLELEYMGLGWVRDWGRLGGERWVRLVGEEEVGNIMGLCGEERC